MSKGTKQIRLGRVIRFIEKMEIVLKTLRDEYTETDYMFGRIEQLEKDINLLKSEFQID